jgi:thiol-disulfide isomerase/thioredoxin
MSDSGFQQSSAAEQSQLAESPQRTSLWPWALLLIALVSVLAWRAWGPAPPEAAGNGRLHPAVGTKFETIALEPLRDGGQPVNAESLRGHVSLINFWGPWCGPCTVEFPHLVEIEAHFRNQEAFRFVSVASNPDPRDLTGLRESVDAFVRQQRAEFPVYRDPDGQTMDALIHTARLPMFGFPTTVLLDRNLQIRGLWEGYRPGDETHVRRAIEALLEEPASQDSPRQTEPPAAAADRAASPPAAEP